MNCNNKLLLYQLKMEIYNILHDMIIETISEILSVKYSGDSFNTCGLLTSSGSKWEVNISASKRIEHL